MRKHKEKIYQYEVVFEPNGAGYTVTVPQLPGLVTEGDNLKEAREMAKDAIRCYLEALLKERIFSKSSQRKNKSSGLAFMPKLPRVPSLLVLRALKRAGFYEYYRSGSHIQLRHKNIKGKTGRVIGI